MMGLHNYSYNLALYWNNLSLQRHAGALKCLSWVGTSVDDPTVSISIPASHELWLIPAIKSSGEQRRLTALYGRLRSRSWAVRDADQLMVGKVLVWSWWATMMTCRTGNKCCNNLQDCCKKIHSFVSVKHMIHPAQHPASSADHRWMTREKQEQGKPIWYHIQVFLKVQSQDVSWIWGIASV